MNTTTFEISGSMKYHDMVCKTEGGIKGNSAYKTVEDESEIANET